MWIEKKGAHVMSKSVHVRAFHDLELLRYVLRCAIERQLSFSAGVNKVYCYCYKPLSCTKEVLFCFEFEFLRRQPLYLFALSKLLLRYTQFIILFNLCLRFSIDYAVKNLSKTFFFVFVFVSC